MDTHTPLKFERKVWTVLGLPFDAVTLREAAQQVMDAIESRQPCFISTPNINFVINSLNDEDFYHSVLDSDLSLADGMPIVWAAKLTKTPLPERVAGSDLFTYLTKHVLAQRKIRVFFFGGEAGVAEKAHNMLNKQMGPMVSCGYFDPGFVDVEAMASQGIINTINASKADFIVVALGAKKGQQWIQLNRDKIEAPVISHLGAVINFVAGNVKRAPYLWQKLGLEWLWRIKEEPGLWYRYVSDGLSLSKLIFGRVLLLNIYTLSLKLRLDYKTKPSIQLIDNKLVLKGSFVGAANDLLSEYFEELVQNDKNINIDMREATCIDGSFMAKMLLLQRHTNKRNKELVLVDFPGRLEPILKYAGVYGRLKLTSSTPTTS